MLGNQAEEQAYTCINGDGKIDLLVGDSVHLVSPARGLTEADVKKKLAEWKGAVQTAQEAVSNAKDEKAREKAEEEYDKVCERRSEFMKEDMTCFVWLYLRK